MVCFAISAASKSLNLLVSNISNQQLYGASMTIDTEDQEANAYDVVCNGFYGRRLNPVDTVSLCRALRRGVAIELAVALARNYGCY
jgi:hypothetical protein